MIDLLTETQAWEPRQIAKRAEWEVRKHFSRDQELILNRKVTGAAQGLYTLSEEESASLALFQQSAFAAQQVARQAEADNALLVQILGVEQAERTLAEQTLLIAGRAAVPAVEEVPEQIDPDTGEVIQEYVPGVPAIPAIEPLAPTIESTDEQGNPLTVDNPAYVQAVEARNTAQAVLDGVGAEVLGWVEQRR